MGYASSKFKVGDKVRVLDASLILGGRKDYYDGMVTKVVRMYSGYPILQSKDGTEGAVVVANEFHAIEKLTGGDTMNYRTVKRKARVGERILITNSRVNRYGNGADMIVERISITGSIYAGHLGRTVLVLPPEYEVIVEDSDIPRITALEAEVSELKAKVQTLEKADKPCVTNVTINAGIGGCAAETGRKFAEAMAKVGLCGKSASMKTPNQLRKATIERAKAFVEAQFSGDYEERKYVVTKKSGHNFVDFVVNEEKRTVVAIFKRCYAGGVSERVIAKCAPGDVFNADIGKAIALGRALGKNVSEFEQAVQPTEVIAGMKVTLDNEKLACANEYLRRNGTILDDTGAKY